MNFTTTAMHVELYIYHLPVSHERSHLRLIDVLYRISTGASAEYKLLYPFTYSHVGKKSS